MSTYVLVHGSWHGAWCWYKIVPRLEQAGHTVVALDLPSHGRDRTPPGDVSMADYVEAIGRVLDAADEPVVLVGHSRGGLAITQAAEERPEKIRSLVYLAAFLIGDGETILPLAFADTDSLIMPNLDVDQDAGWDMLRRDAFKATLYADCSEDDVALAHALLTPEPSGPTNTPMRTTAQRFGRIPRVYIELLQDRAVSPALQRQMYTAMPCRKVLSIDASHSAYFSRPDELASKILHAGGDIYDLRSRQRCDENHQHIEDEMRDH
ncbi:MAG: alpha/beta fold hydrolase [Deltaproteobacteria bacterium]|nr:alpha/beta fold hydrolase [Deltaproteobacteria bacterium]MBI3388038.1 alpha/beta fold hydrolase [Deltaproteobacteria bacterium]